MIDRMHHAYQYWLVQLHDSTTKREFLYRCGRLDGTLDLLRLHYGKDSVEYKALLASVHTTEHETAQRLGLSYPDDEQ